MVPQPEKPFLVLGLGNPYCGNDAVGFEVVRRLREEAPRFSQPVEFAATSEGPGGWVQALESRPGAVIVDAANCGGGLGALVRWSIRPGPGAVDHPEGAHGADFFSALNRFAESGFELPAVIHIVGVEVGERVGGFGAAMDPAVETGLCEAVDAVKELLAKVVRDAES